MQIVFGTDGVRDIANTKLSPEVAFIVARAGVGTILNLNNDPSRKAKVVVGMDTRISSPMLEAAVSSGISSLGVDVLRAGVVPTPAVARLVVELGASLGIVISASHNPVEYNGIKFFGSDGFKLSDDVEKLIEDNAKLECAPQGSIFPRPDGREVGSISELSNAADMYVDYVTNVCNYDLSSLHIVLDCANGAASNTSLKALTKLGAKVTQICAQPNGININDKCGSTDTTLLVENVLANGADLGLAHDGDADRVIACDSEGNIIDGDVIMAITAITDNQKEIVATNYSNLGLVQAMEKMGGSVVMADSGDRYVLDEMRKRGLKLGGEKSGHVIFLDRSTTGDGLITGIELAKSVVDAKKPLSELKDVVKHFPQKMRNIRVEDKDKFYSNERIKETIELAQSELGKLGRVFVRPSGTESLIRVMAEASEVETVDRILDQVCSVVEEELC